MMSVTEMNKRGILNPCSCGAGEPKYHPPVKHPAVGIWRAITTLARYECETCGAEACDKTPAGALRKWNRETKARRKAMNVITNERKSQM